MRGYWVTRYLDEARPDLLKRHLARRLPHDALESALAAELGVDWSGIDAVVISHVR